MIVIQLASDRVPDQVYRFAAPAERRLHMILLKCDDEPDLRDGVRFLVERLWPRGIRKTALPQDSWLKDGVPDGRDNQRCW